MIKAEQIFTLVKPFVEEGKILPRTKAQINENIGDFVYLIDDNQLLACAGLKNCKEDVGEIYSLAVSKKSQKIGLSLKLLNKIMKKAKAEKFSKVFALTKYGTDWFIKNGFIQMKITDLPKKRQVLFNQDRNSSIFFKDVN
ncbi:GCN5-related N-acetyltransferase [Candidatus Ruthia magnifica str. Cm (Calyptogena magnifica)]|uniref:Amino-acid acetyltransferase n=1 Tax=Ruthia magnifica subsp. Calyptogena magnifica TaxID=413404 RepID=A1AWH5_RUTMC|nr:GNAT family N-acetyltransferase [Candidatus Ruthturnera calyptogenae]ABL02282.1 GCN5-related N-acetyltransferase [Candidatus Ruthia magnifica str. Cm (Calyptogena magnifica)]